MTPEEIKTLELLLMKRIQPRDVEEGVAIATLAMKAITELTQKAQPKQDER